MNRIDAVVEAIRTELTAWHERPDGVVYSAPGWWARIHSNLDQIKSSAGDPANLKKSINGLMYTLTDLGPVSLSVAPSFALLREIADKTSSSEPDNSD
ncbi:MAG TPA: hypothetical protein VGZ26_06970 [Pirellulales bacterium]|jgi:hypothetical protein|nr:hypothetical protein [Pirellulales bacterium]